MSAIEVEAIFKERQDEARELAEKAEQARQLERQARDMRADLARLEERRARFAALGKAHLEVPFRHYDEHHRIELEMEPLRSKLSGAELAAELESDIAYVRGQLEQVEAEIARLLEK